MHALAAYREIVYADESTFTRRTFATCANTLKYQIFVQEPDMTCSERINLVMAKSNECGVFTITITKDNINGVIYLDFLTNLAEVAPSTVVLMDNFAYHKSRVVK